jgi:hypothetical protein
LNCKNTQDERRQDCLDVEICRSLSQFLATKRSVCGPRAVRPSDQRSRFAWSQTSRTRLKRRAHARESCARIAAGPCQSRSVCSGIPLPKDAGPGVSSGLATASVQPALAAAAAVSIPGSANPSTRRRRSGR